MDHEIYLSLPILVKYTRNENIEYNYRQIIVLGFYANVSYGMYTIISCFPATCCLNLWPYYISNKKVKYTQINIGITPRKVHPNISNEIMLPDKMCLNKFHNMKSNCDNWTGGLHGSRGVVYAEFQQPRQQWNLGRRFGHVEPTYI